MRCVPLAQLLCSQWKLEAWQVQEEEHEGARNKARATVSMLALETPAETQEELQYSG